MNINNLSLIEKVYLCGKAMGYDIIRVSCNEPQHTLRIKSNGINNNQSYWPITNELQAIELAKKFCLKLDYYLCSAEMPVEIGIKSNYLYQGMDNETINYSIINCIADMQQTKYSDIGCCTSGWREHINKLSNIFNNKN